MRTEADYDVILSYKIIYEDEWFLAVEKPAPLPVHPGGRFLTKNLLSLLKKDRDGYLSIVNRLDSETSGLVLAAKSSEAAGALGKIFEFRRIEKEYEAILLGVPPEPSGSLDQSLGFRQVERFRMRCHDPEGEKALTLYETVTANVFEGQKYTHVRVRPETGRMHQIRAHFALAGCPIAGDKIYIEPAVYTRYIEAGWCEDMLSVTKAPRLLLHAVRLTFVHPVTGGSMDLRSEVPGEFINHSVQR
jgi:RluA family pseudouridine synthase